MRIHTSPVDDYINRTFVRETPLLEHVRHTGNALVDGMQVSPSEGALLAWYTSLIHAKDILEIGTFVGYSTLWMAQSLPKGGHITTLEARDDHAKIAQTHFDTSSCTDSITCMRGNALDSLAILSPDAAYDLIFIDAQKSEYDKYFALTHPLLRTGGLLIADNTLLFGHMAGVPKQRASASAIASVSAYNSTVATHPSYRTIMLPTQEGLTVSVKI